MKLVVDSLSETNTWQTHTDIHPKTGIHDNTKFTIQLPDEGVLCSPIKPLEKIRSLMVLRWTEVCTPTGKLSEIVFRMAQWCSGQSRGQLWRSKVHANLILGRIQWTWTWNIHIWSSWSWGCPRHHWTSIYGYIMIWSNQQQHTPNVAEMSVSCLVHDRRSHEIFQTLWWVLEVLALHKHIVEVGLGLEDFLCGARHVGLQRL